MNDHRPFDDPSRRRSLQKFDSPLMRFFRKMVWRRLPVALRARVLAIVSRFSRGPLPIDADADDPVCVAGILSTATGIGEGARLSGRALVALGYRVRSFDIDEVLGTEPGQDRALPLERGAGTVLLHFNPDHLTPLLMLMNRSRLRGKRLIGYWAWELARIPDLWISALDEVDEVWTPSDFVSDAVRRHTDKPVRTVPHPVVQGRRGSPRRAHFGLGNQFVVLTMFSFASSFQRKNPIAAVRAFKQAFGSAADRLLIVKVSQADESPEEMALLLAAIGDAPNIRVEQRVLSDDERLDLIASADVLLSLHRSEGFGLVMAEAMAAGVAVVATNWSGNLDFMDETSALLVPFRMIAVADCKGVYDGREQWADPDVAVAAAYLQAVAADPARYEDMRRAARAMVEERLGLEGFRDAVLRPLGPPRRRAEVDASVPPPGRIAVFARGGVA
jgi:glycosyltransferase involved in cell wall biosynthesis